jgi:hypothetical protein
MDGKVENDECEFASCEIKLKTTFETVPSYSWMGCLRLPQASFEGLSNLQVADIGKWSYNSV